MITHFRNLSVKTEEAFDRNSDLVTEKKINLSARKKSTHGDKFLKWVAKSSPITWKMYSIFAAAICSWVIPSVNAGCGLLGFRSTVIENSAAWKTRHIVSERFVRPEK